jgi:tRNA G18 (ribose-2'-O)-methylase SpoU
LFIAEGELVVRRLIGSRFRARSVFLASTRLEAMRSDLDQLPEDAPVFVADQEVLNGVVGFNIHRGVLAVGVRPQPPSIAELLRSDGPFIILEDLFNHDNTGAIFRNASALAGTGCAVLLTPRTADPLYRKCIRVSMGNVLSIPFSRLSDFPSPGGVDATALRDASIELWALTPAADAEPIDLAVAAAARSFVRKRIALVLGSEGPGLTDAAIGLAHRRVTIPMLGAHENVDSLNVAVAAAIALHALNACESR